MTPNVTQQVRSKHSQLCYTRTSCCEVAKHITQLILALLKRFPHKPG